MLSTTLSHRNRVLSTFSFSLNVLALSVLTMSTQASWANDLTGDTSQMLVRQLPVHVERYVSASTLNTRTQNADSTSQLIQETPDNLLLHMEALRQGYHHYGQNREERDKILKVLKARYLKNETDAQAFFDYGYAQLVFEANKNGLFFLRKANDKLMTPTTNLAYGMAQVDADHYFEGESPMLMTARKLDAVYKLKDALTLHKAQPQAGLWPTFVGVRQALQPYEAYESMLKEDFSLIYVPRGASNLSARGFQLFTNPIVEGTPTIKPAAKKETHAKLEGQSGNRYKNGSTPQEPGRKKSSSASASSTTEESGFHRFFKRMLGLETASNNASEQKPEQKIERLSQVVAPPAFVAAKEPASETTPVASTETEPANIFLNASATAPYGQLPFTDRHANYASSTPMSSAALASTPLAAGAMAFPNSDRCPSSTPDLGNMGMKFAVVMKLVDTQLAPNAIEFYNDNPEQSPYYVRVLDINKRIVGQLYSSKAPFIMEDINKDGVYELVVRQYQINPMDPVLVYQWNGSCFVQDRQVAQYFE